MGLGGGGQRDERSSVIVSGPGAGATIATEATPRPAAANVKPPTQAAVSSARRRDALGAVGDSASSVTLS